MRVPKKMADDIAAQVVEELLAHDYISHPNREKLYQIVSQAVMEELGVEDKIDDEVRQILTEHADELQRANVQYHEMFKKVKAKLQRERNLIF
jgi:hypothetical protein